MAFQSLSDPIWTANPLSLCREKSWGAISNENPRLSLETTWGTQSAETPTFSPLGFSPLMDSVPAPKDNGVFSQFLLWNEFTSMDSPRSSTGSRFDETLPPTPPDMSVQSAPIGSQSYFSQTRPERLMFDITQKDCEHPRGYEHSRDCDHSRDCEYKARCAVSPALSVVEGSDNSSSGTLEISSDDGSRTAGVNKIEGHKCTHGRSYWKRQRAKKGRAWFVCFRCGSKWKTRRVTGSDGVVIEEVICEDDC